MFDPDLYEELCLQEFLILELLGKLRKEETQDEFGFSSDIRAMTEAHLLALLNNVVDLGLGRDKIKTARMVTSNFLKLRELHKMVACLRTLDHWQSPGLISVNTVASGNSQNLEKRREYDYQRARHQEGEAYEQRFVEEYYPGQGRESVVFNSGMAAIKTALEAIVAIYGAEAQEILYSSSLYHESRFLLKGLYDTAWEIDFSDSSKLCDMLKSLRPSVLVFETVSNASEILEPALRVLIEYLFKQDKHILVLVDNTCGTFLHPSLNDLVLACKHTVILVESLAKYYQYGMDLVTGGIITLLSGTKETAQLLRTLRTHSGAHICDFATSALPAPSRRLLTSRLRRVGRNAALLRTHLSNVEKETIISRVQYINVKEHGAFLGGCINLKLVDPTVEFARHFVSALLREAKARGVALVEGTSFGFDVTRVYLVESLLPEHVPFLRISVGAEAPEELTEIAKLFADVARSLSASNLTYSSHHEPLPLDA